MRVRQIEMSTAVCASSAGLLNATDDHLRLLAPEDVAYLGDRGAEPLDWRDRTDEPFRTGISPFGPQLLSRDPLENCTFLPTGVVSRPPRCRTQWVTS